MADDKLNTNPQENTLPDVAALLGSNAPPEVVPDQKRRGRSLKEQAGVFAGEKEKVEEPRTGRPSKVNKAVRE